MHAEDVADALRRACERQVTGAFNLASDPVIGIDRPGPSRAVRSGVNALFRLHLARLDPGWLDLARAVPLMDTSRARAVLGWSPSISADDTLLELLSGMRHHAGFVTPPLVSEPETAGAFTAARAGGIAPSADVGSDPV